MNYQLYPGLIKSDGQLLETRRRESDASNELKTRLGLPLDTPIYANIELAPIEEYIVLYGVGIPKNQSRYWDLRQINQDFRIESLYIDAPLLDSLTFTILDTNQSVIFDFPLFKNDTPYNFPTAPLQKDLIIKVTANSDINLIRITGKPIIIREHILASNSFPV